MSDNKCFLSGKIDCELVEVPFNGIIYYVDDNLADEFSLKKLKEKIEEQVNKNLTEKEEKDKLETEKKSKALDDIKNAAASLGLSAEALGRFLLGQTEPVQASAPIETTAVSVPASTAVSKPKIEDGFVEVEGTLKSKTMNVSAEEGVSGGVPAYSKVNDSDGKAVVESYKRVKRLEDGGIVEKSNMGTTVIRINQQDPNLDKMLKQTDENRELVRAAVSGSGRMSGGQTVDCPLCSGSGITKIGHVTCPKCGGAGMIQV